jgi:hypothetical protein
MTLKGALKGVSVVVPRDIILSPEGYFDWYCCGVFLEFLTKMSTWAMSEQF